MNFSPSPNHQPAPVRPLDELLSEEVGEQVNRIEALLKTGDEDDRKNAYEILSRLLCNWNYQDFYVTGLGWKRLPWANIELLGIGTLYDELGNFFGFEIADGQVCLSFLQTSSEKNPEDTLVVFPYHDIILIDRAEDLDA